MPHPWVNRESKTTLRWYADPRLLNRQRPACKPANGEDLCPWALSVPNRTIIPFQVRATAGASVATSWKVNDLEGNEVIDLSANLGDLQFADYANPPRTVIMLEEPLLHADLTEGRYEMVIVTDQGTYYSETFEVMCGKELGEMENSDQSDITTFTNWGYDSYSGIYTATFLGAGDPATDGTFVGEKRINLTDNLLYTWNGTAWSSSTPVNGSYWIDEPGGTWYTYGGGGWQGVAQDPMVHDGDNTCWYDGLAMVPWEYTPSSTTLPGYVLLTFTVFRGSPITGSLALYVGGVLIDTYTDSENGSQQSVFVYLNEGDTIRFVPSGGFNGCLFNSSFTEYSDGTECAYSLSWRNCGDLGTVAYADNDFRNHLYLNPTSKQAVDLTDPTPVFKIGSETDDRQSDVFTQVRKDIDWKLIAKLPWYVIDALTEAAACDDVTMRPPYATGDDPITDLRFALTWDDKCLGTLEMTFKADDATVSDNCCTAFDEPCEGDGYANFTSSYAASGDLYIETDSGYYSVRAADGTVATYDSGSLAVINQAGQYCAWASDSNGNVSGSTTLFSVSHAYVTSLDVSGMRALESLTTNGSTTLASLDITGLLSLSSIDAAVCALTEASVDALFNALNQEIDGGFVDVSSGTNSAPSSASDTARTALTANVWAISTN